jgi:PAS domain S-box-containing protein
MVNQSKGDQEEMLRLALTAAQAGVWSWDLTTNTVHWSDEYFRIFGFEPGSVQPSVEAGFSHIHPEDLARVEAVVREAVERGTPVDEVHRVVWPDGSVHWVRGMSRALFDPQGKPARLAGIAIDVSEQKQIEAELRKTSEALKERNEALRESESALRAYSEKLESSNRDLEEFAYIASHDLQEPLRKIASFGNALLATSSNLDERQRSYLERMRSAADRMQDMISDLLALSRISTQGKPFVSIDLAQVAAEVLSNLELQIRRTGGRVELGDLPVVDGDPFQMRQLFQNLIGNALKYHRQGVPPLVKVWSEPATSDQRPPAGEEDPVAGRRSLVAILIEDNGIGFDESSADRIFQPFQRLAGKSQYEGTGIGLAICKKIVERHGGEIAARSAPGIGSTFIVTLPVQS